MRTRSRRQFGWAVAGALAFVVGAPALSHAQQSGLFPLAPIRRERVPCPMEDPVYKLYRHQYFGYHPTCWRRFPSGWGCPSPEAPNPAASFREIPRDLPPTDTGNEGQPPADGQPNPAPDEMTPGQPRNTQPPGNLPPLPPGDRSPFDLDTKPNTPPPVNPPADRPSASAEPAPRAGGAAADLPAASPPPVTAPTSPTGPGGATSSSTSPHGDDPLLALPDPTAANPGSPPPAVTGGFIDPRAAAAAAPATPPRRQSLLSGLFSGLKRR